jgi:hypothetical protein
VILYSPISDPEYILSKETLQQNVCCSSILCQHWCYEVLSNTTLILFQMAHFLLSHNNYYAIFAEVSTTTGCI